MAFCVVVEAARRPRLFGARGAIPLSHHLSLPPPQATHAQAHFPPPPPSTMADLLDYIDFRALEALNVQPGRGVENALKQVRGRGVCGRERGETLSP